MSIQAMDGLTARGELMARLTDVIRRIGSIGTLIAAAGLVAGLLLANQALESIALGVGVAAAIGAAFFVWAKLRIDRAKLRIELAKLAIEKLAIEEIDAVRTTGDSARVFEMERLFAEKIKELGPQDRSVMKTAHIAEEIADKLETMSPTEKCRVGT